MLGVRRDGEEDAGGRGLRGGLLSGLLIEQIYGFASLQGAPQPGRRPYGVPPGGAFDQESLALANTLVGNDPATPALEMALATLEAVAEVPLYCATVGSGGSGAFHLREGERLSLKPGEVGARCYLAVAQGWTGRTGERVAKGVLRVSTPSTGQPKTLASPPSSLQGGVLNLLPGPAASLGYERVLGVTCKVRLDSDRVGVRLEGPQLEQPPERTSEPTLPGALQVTRDGSLIILGPDGPTIGGYPVIGYIPTADLDKVGQLRPGSILTFRATDSEVAAASWLDHQNRLNDTVALLRIGN